MLQISFLNSLIVFILLRYLQNYPNFKKIFFLFKLSEDCIRVRKVEKTNLRFVRLLTVRYTYRVIGQ